MPMSFDYDLSTFSAPLSDDAPSGENLQATSEGRALRSSLRDQREEARRIERKADEGDASDGGWAGARSIWEQVRDKAWQVLVGQSRDLDVTGLCIEALARTDGFAGLACGFGIARTLVESQWATLFPIPDPEDGPADEAAVVAERTLPLQRLVGIDSEGLLLPAILHVPLVSGRSDEHYALCHWRSSRELVGEESEEKIKLAVERGAVSPQQFQDAVSGTPIDSIRQVYLDLEQAAKAWEALCDAVTQASNGEAYVPAGPLRDLFEECAAAIATFAPAAIPKDSVDSGEGAAAGGTEAGADGGGGFGGGQPSDREAAFRQLSAIADFFERHDPHSLVAAQIRSIVRLGRLPREEYYRQLLRDEAALALLFRVTGLDDDAAASSGGSGDSES